MDMGDEHAGGIIYGWPLALDPQVSQPDQELAHGNGSTPILPRHAFIADLLT